MQRGGDVGDFFPYCKILTLLCVRDCREKPYWTCNVKPIPEGTPTKLSKRA